MTTIKQQQQQEPPTVKTTKYANKVFPLSKEAYEQLKDLGEEV